MSLRSAKKSVKSRLAQIADSLAEKHDSFTTSEVFELFSGKIDQLNEDEKLVLIGVGARVLAGRLPVSKSSVNWKSPTIAGLGLHKSIKLRLKGEDGKYRARNYPVENITRKMFKEHLNAPSTSKARDGTELSLEAKLKQYLDEMEKAGYSEETRLFEYRD